MTKQALRKIYKEKRLTLDARQKLKLDDLLLLQFQQLYLDDDIQLLMSYWPMSSMNEPNTHLFSRYMHHSLPHLQMAYPVADFSDCSMRAILIDEDTVYTTDEYGITTPKTGEAIDPEAIDIVFVPMLVCDVEGYRVGYGKGFYDRFLARCAPHAVTIGFSYFEPVPRIEDTHEFDIPLNYCITPEQIYEF